MTRLPRFVTSLPLSFVLVALVAYVPVRGDQPQPAETSTTAPAVAPAAAPAVDKALLDQVDDFWHYGLIARYDLAADSSQKILDANAQPADLATAFQTVAGRKKQDIDQWMLRWRTIPVPSAADIKADPSLQAQKDAIIKLKANTDKLFDLFNQGLATHNQDAQYIHSVIAAMSAGVRAYQNNLPRLEKSGELAVRVAINILRSQRTDDLPYKQTARQAIRDMGRKALNPLLAATEAKDPTLLADVVTAIGDIGYDVSLPYLSRLVTATDTAESVRTVARQAIARIAAGESAALKPTDQFYNLAQRFYYNGALLGASDETMANMWYWTDDSGLTNTPVPATIFGDLQAKRLTEYALKMDPSNDKAVSLWLAANTKRDVDLPAGAVDPTAKDLPDAHYYNVAAGVKYLNDAVNRALKDNNAALSLKLIQSLEDIVGQSNIGVADSPISRALYFPNRLVRYEAAFALASSLPSKPFPGSERVVPLLVEAISQTSKPNVLVVAPNTDNQLNNIQAAIKTLGYPVAGAVDSTSILAASSGLASVDVIIVSEDTNVQSVMSSAAQSARLQGASILVLTHSANNPYVVAATQNALLNTAAWPGKEQLADTLKAEIDKARVHGGAVVLSDQQGTDYALRAAALLAQLAQTRNLAFDLSVAQPGVLAALSTDARPEILKGAGKVLADLDSPSSQAGLLTKALDETVPAEVRVALFKDLAVNAKFFGNHLDAGQAADLQKVVQGAKTADIRGAAAEARGALNLPAEQTKKLILDQSKV